MKKIFFLIFAIIIMSGCSSMVDQQQKYKADVIKYIDAYNTMTQNITDTSVKSLQDDYDVAQRVEKEVDGLNPPEGYQDTQKTMKDFAQKYTTFFKLAVDEARDNKKDPVLYIKFNDASKQVQDMFGDLDKIKSSFGGDQK